MADYIRYANQGATRNFPLSQQMISALSFLPEIGVEAEVFSGGQPAKGSGGARVGSVRHDHGDAADVFFYKDGRRLDWSNPDDLPIFQEIVSRGRSSGLTGFGAGKGYMQPGSMHIGFGNPAVWGSGGKGANAPEWLRQAYYGADAPQGGKPMATGLLGNPTVSTQGQAPEQPKSIWGNQDMWDRLAIAFNSMRMQPDQGLAQAAQSRISERAKSAQTASQRNATADWLESQGADELAAGVRSNSIPANTGLSMYQAQAKAAQGGGQYRQITGQDAAAMGLDPNKVYNLGPEGKVTGIGGGDTILQTGMSGEDALRTELLQSQGKILGGIVETAGKSAQLAPDINALRELALAGPSGPIQGRLAEMFPEFNDVAAARQAIIRRVAPQMRVEGSGSTSDIEYAGMIESLGRLTNTPEANAAVADSILAKYALDQQRAALVQRYTMNDMTYDEMVAELQVLNQQSILPPSLKRLISASPQATTSDGAATHRLNSATGQVEEIKR